MAICIHRKKAVYEILPSVMFDHAEAFRNRFFFFDRRGGFSTPFPHGRKHQIGLVEFHEEFRLETRQIGFVEREAGLSE